MNDFISDTEMSNMPDFIPDAEANKYFGEQKSTKQKSTKYESAPTVAGTPLGNVPIIGGMAKSVESYGRMLGGAGYEAYRGAKSAMGDKNAYVDQSGQTVQNPFLSEQDLTKFQPTQVYDPITKRNQNVLPAEGVSRTLGAMGTAAALYNPAATVKTVGSAVKSILRKPTDLLGDIRGYFLDKSPIVAENLSKIKPKLLEDIFYKNAAGITQREARGALGRLLSNVTPLDIGGKEVAKVSLDVLYKNLSALEKLGKAYGRGGDAGSGAISQGTNIASHIVREFAKNESPIVARGLTDIMRALYAIGGKAPGLLKGAGITGAFLYGLNELKNTLGGDTESTGLYRR